ncbi:MAG TPA: maleylpyruvate isomerase family mycothiol-dependent enzyme [Acidimicrobiia bacterium]|nr:maleylpyruvate isomerase family mycothiol-dependent enzyme [Acidimicrobiia bacterium]
MKLSPHYDDPSVLMVDGPADDQAEVVVRQRRRMESVLGAFGDDEWAAPSRCDGWSNQDVIAHLVTVNGFWELSVRAGLAGDPTRILATFDPAATPPLLVEPFRAQSGKEVFEQFVASNEGFLDALDGLDAAGWSTPAEAPPGHITIRLLAAHALWDAWIHERDILLPLGQTQAREPDEVASCLRYAAVIGPVLTLGQNAFRGELAVDATDPTTAFTIAVGEKVELRDGVADTPALRGDALELVEALSVRRPLPADAPSEWRTLFETGLATVFDQL